jgi:peptidoglycan/xylan/chitin deacetylase (PgdA/CDA1 family)
MLQEFLTGLSRRAARHYRSKPFALRNRRPIVSFTFDDVPDSAYHNGAAILEQNGCRGTFYVAAGTCGLPDQHWTVIDCDQVRELHDKGHEIGCHTFSHVNVETLDEAAMDAELQQNQALLRDICGDIEITNFCFPFGRLSLPRKLQLQRRFDTCRGIYEGINAGTVDLGLLRVIELYDSTLTPEKLGRVLRETRECNGWLIFYTHDVAERPSWIGCSPTLMRNTLAEVRAMGFDCLTIRDALRAAGYGSAETEAAA